MRSPVLDTVCSQGIPRNDNDNDNDNDNNNNNHHHHHHHHNNKERNLPVFRHGMPLRVSRVKKKKIRSPFLDMA